MGGSIGKYGQPLATLGQIDMAAVLAGSIVIRFTTRAGTEIQVWY